MTLRVSGKDFVSFVLFVVYSSPELTTNAGC
jgi:hypothetical protein